MIYTVTFNPSLDYFVTVEDFEVGRTNRTAAEQMFPGGKGINVSIVLKNLGIESTALGFIAGFTGDEIEREVQALGLRHDFVRLDTGISRINVKMKGSEGTEINGLGPHIDSGAVELLLEKLDKLNEGDLLILAGSIPASMPQTIYRDILARLADRNVGFVVDATGDLLVNVLEYHPFLIKPNSHELGEIFHCEFHSREEVIPYARRLREMGASNVLVSLSSLGAVLVDSSDQVHVLPAPEGHLVNGVGAGDSMVAGFIAGWMEKKDYEHAFRMAVAAGSASAFSDHLATREDMEVLMGGRNDNS